MTVCTLWYENRDRVLTWLMISRSKYLKSSYLPCQARNEPMVTPGMGTSMKISLKSVKALNTVRNPGQCLHEMMRKRAKEFLKDWIEAYWIAATACLNSMYLFRTRNRAVANATHKAVDMVGRNLD